MPNTFSRVPDFMRLMRFDKPIGTFLVLWPTLWALWIAAAGIPDLKVLVIFVLGVILMRAAGCVINDFADREIDGDVARTKDRPLVSGKIHQDEALVLFCCLCMTAFVLVLFTNHFTVMLSLGAVFLAAAYPFMKRYTYFPQMVLGAAFAWSIPMAFAAQTGAVPLDTWLLYTSTVIWVVAYDTFYAMVDRKDDLKIGVKSTAVLFGEADRAITGFLQFIMLWAMVLVGDKFELGLYYQLGLGAAALLFIYQQYLIRDRKEALCFKAFLNNNWVGAVIFAGIALDFALK